MAWFPLVLKMESLNRIAVDPLVMSGHPCLRGQRITVANILRLLAAHHDTRRILEAYPALGAEDIDACLEYAAVLASEGELGAIA